ncbi:MAG: zinc metallopeptidase [Vampirovibrionales bacterium]|nr:zinc metallopeptidase [Vampirovibrionales bacterium]
MLGMPMMMDPAYTLVMVVGGLLVFLPQLWVKSTYQKYVQVPSIQGLTGAQVAKRILSEQGIGDVTVEVVAGQLSDHYDPSAKAVRLSEENYYGHSVAGIAVAAHEVGHAIQHAVGYYPVVMRSALVPAVNLGSQLGPLLFYVALGMGVTGAGIPQWSLPLAWLGVALFGTAVLFHVVTLPVELNASARALALIERGGILSPSEVPAGRKVLTAAAFTYVAAALYALIQLAYFVFRLLAAQQSDRR